MLDLLARAWGGSLGMVDCGATLGRDVQEDEDAGGKRQGARQEGFGVLEPMLMRWRRWRWKGRRWRRCQQQQQQQQEQKQVANADTTTSTSTNATLNSSTQVLTGTADPTLAVLAHDQQKQHEQRYEYVRRRRVCKISSCGDYLRTSC